MVFISFLNLIFSKNTFALYTPTLSVSVDNSAMSVNGNQVINSASQTSELPIRVTVNTNNKTGYTATLNTETNETALANTESSSGAKIDSIDTNKLLTNFSQNTWGFLSPLNGNYQPIPNLSNSVNLFSTAAKTSGNGSFDFKIGMKLSDNLESGNYTNKLVISIISNPYERRSIMTTGKDFNRKVDSIVASLSNDDGWGNKESVGYVYRSTESARFIPAEAINVEDDASSDYPIKIWYDAASKILFYWTEADKIFLNKDSRYMFRGFTEAEYINTSIFDSSEVEDMAYFFYKANNLRSLDLTKFNTEKVTSMDGLFSGSGNLLELDLKTFKTSNVLYMNNMFYGVEKLVNLDLSMFDTKKVLKMQHMFHDMKNIENLDVSSFNTSKVIDMSCMFSYMEKMKNLNLFNFDTSSVKEMTLMFNGSKSLEGLNVANFNTENVVDARGMFQDLKNIRQIDVSNFDTRKMTTMNAMFSGMEKLETLDVSNFDTSNVVDMSSMFEKLKTLTYLDLSNFDTRNVKYMSSVFEYMENIENLSLPNFSTDNVTTMSSMFKEMYKLKRLDISNFKTPKLTSVYRMFACEYGTGSLEAIYVNEDFNIDNITDDNMLFYRQDKLRGGNGSFAANNYTAGKEWLKVDRPGVQGYFTRKS